MNERLFATRVRQALDESAEHLPFRVTQRLERARAEALARARPLTSAELSLAAPRGGARTLALGGDSPSRLVRLLMTLGPLLLVLAGFYGISAWEEAQRAAETADIDAEIVLSSEEDEVPLSALADRGFGAYLRNSRQ